MKQPEKLMLLRLYFDYKLSLEITGFLKSKNPKASESMTGFKKV